MLKKKTIEKPILSLPSFDKVFQVETDASGTIIRVVMSQEQIPVAYFSKKLNEEKKSIPHITRSYILLYKLSKNVDIT